MTSYIVMANLLDPNDTYFWTALALIGFFAILVYFKVPDTVGKSLDARSDAIRKELDDARRMREEAQQLLADYQRRSKEAEEEAKEIVAAAKREAEALASRNAQDACRNSGTPHQGRRGKDLARRSSGRE